MNIGTFSKYSNLLRGLICMRTCYFLKAAKHTVHQDWNLIIPCCFRFPSYTFNATEVSLISRNSPIVIMYE